MRNAKPFQKHTAIISGGLGDIGRAMALEFGSRGAAIALGDLHDPAEAGPLLKYLRRREIREILRREENLDCRLRQPLQANLDCAKRNQIRMKA